MTEIDLELLKNAGTPAATANGVEKPAAPVARPPGARRPPPKRKVGPRTAAGAIYPAASQLGEHHPPTIPAPALPQEEQERDAMAVWPRVMEQQGKEGFAPDALGCRITRIGIGPLKSPETQMSPFGCELIAGSEGVSPAEELYNYIVDFYHLAAPGPSLYKLHFYRKNGGQKIPDSTCELRLEAPDQIRRQRQAMEDAARARQPRGGAYGVGYRSPFVGGFGNGGVAPQVSQTQTVPQSAPNLDNPREQELLRQLSSENGFYKGLLEGRAAVVAPAAPAVATPAPFDPRVPPPGLTSGEWEKIQLERQAAAIGPAVAQAVAQTLAGMGFTPQGIQAMQHPPAPPVPAALEKPTDAFDQVRKTFAMFQEFRKLDKGLAALVGAPESEAPEAVVPEVDPAEMKPVMGGMELIPGLGKVLYGQRLEDENWTDYLVRLYMHNPGLGNKIIGVAMEKLDPKAIGAFMQAIATRSAPKPPVMPQAAASPQMAPGPAGPPTPWSPTG